MRVETGPALMLLDEPEQRWVALELCCAGASVSESFNRTLSIWVDVSDPDLRTSGCKEGQTLCHVDPCNSHCTHTLVFIGPTHA